MVGATPLLALERKTNGKRIAKSWVLGASYHLPSFAWRDGVVGGRPVHTKSQMWCIPFLAITASVASKNPTRWRATPLLRGDGPCSSSPCQDPRPPGHFGTRKLSRVKISSTSDVKYLSCLPSSNIVRLGNFGFGNPHVPTLGGKGKTATTWTWQSGVVLGLSLNSHKNLQPHRVLQSHHTLHLELVIYFQAFPTAILSCVVLSTSFRVDMGVDGRDGLIPPPGTSMLMENTLQVGEQERHEAQPRTVKLSALPRPRASCARVYEFPSVAQPLYHLATCVCLVNLGLDHRAGLMDGGFRGAQRGTSGRVSFHTPHLQIYTTPSCLTYEQIEPQPWKVTSSGTEYSRM